MPRKLILLIDHETSVRMVLHVCLSRLGGWDVLSVGSVQRGFETLATQNPDAILLDAPMLETNDFTFVQQIKNSSFSRSIPILLITAKAHWFSRQTLEEAGIVGAIAKPFNPITLPSQIAELLNWTLEYSQP